MFNIDSLMHVVIARMLSKLEDDNKHTISSEGEHSSVFSSIK